MVGESSPNLFVTYSNEVTPHVVCARNELATVAKGNNGAEIYNANQGMPHISTTDCLGKRYEPQLTRKISL